MDKTKNNSRRKFLSLAISSSAALASGKVFSQQKTEESEKVKMLTPDGQLVEVEKVVLDQVSSRKKANNKDIFEWANRKSKA